MAKIAFVGYGHDGRGLGTTQDGYTYIVNDNVRTKDVIQPIATSRAGRKFATTGMVRHSFGENTVKGQNAKQELSSKIQKESPTQLTRDELDRVTKEKLTQVYSGKEVGAYGSKKKGTNGISDYNQMTRGGNLDKQMQKDPNTVLSANAQETYDSYVKKYMSKGEN